MFRADLHCHSTCSDGSLTPEELILLAKEKGLSALSITDHDTIGAYQTEFLRFAETQEILVCPGVEFSSSFKSKSIHVLGYAFPIPNPIIEKFCLEHYQRRKRRNLNILEKLRRFRMPIEEQELSNFNIPVVGRPHIAKLMVEKGYVKDVKEAFQKYIGDNKPCYDPGPAFSVEQTISILHEGGGKAFIAHPHLIKYKNVIKYLLSLPFDGIECYYARFSPAQEKKWLDIAKEKNLMISGGSDFHGSFKPGIELGSSWVDEETFQIIMKS